MYVVGIAGGSGAGKTRLAEAVRERFGRDRAAVLRVDDYYRADGPPAGAALPGWFDTPAAFDDGLLGEHLQGLRSGSAIEAPRYDFSVHARAAGGRRIDPKPLLLVEGLFALYWEPVVRLIDLKVFVDVAADIRFRRRLARDLRERHRSRAEVRLQWRRGVSVHEGSHVLPARDVADLILDGTAPVDRQVASLLARGNIGA